MKTSFHRMLNKALRAENPYALEPWLLFLKLFISALEKLPSETSIVWRGVVGNVDDSDFEENRIFTWLGINSCSSKVDTARTFVGSSGTLFCINTTYGKNIAKYSANRGEDEVILMPGTRLRVHSGSLEDGFHIVYLNEW